MSRIATAIAAGAALSLILGGCAPSGPVVASGSRVTVAWGETYTSANPQTEVADGSANAAIAHATNAGFTYYNDVPELVWDESFGRVQKLSDDPLVVRYTVADGVVWSDGTAVDAADLLLAWVAQSGAYNDAGFDREAALDPETGELANPAGAVYFDSPAARSAHGGMALATTLPKVSADRKSIDITYDEPFADWEDAFYGSDSLALPAHVVAKHALDIADSQEAKDAVVHAVTDHDDAALAPLSAFWNTGFNFTDMPASRDLLVGNGPYVVTDFIVGQYTTLSANPHYVGDRRPMVEEIVIRYIPDQFAAVQALSTGEVQVIAPAADLDVLTALNTLDFDVESTLSSRDDRLDLVFEGSKSGVFVDPLVREAFLTTVPRELIRIEALAPLGSAAAVRNSFIVFPGSPGYADITAGNGSREFAEVDIATAKNLMGQAGLVTAEVCILYPPGDAVLAAEFVLIQESAAQAGFTVTDCSSDNWRERLGVPGEYDAVLTSSTAHSLGVSGALARYASDGSKNVTGYASETVDRLLASLASETDQTRQLSLIGDVESELWSDFYGLPLAQRGTTVAHNADAVSGVSASPLSPGIFWNVWQWAAVTPAPDSR